MDLRSKGMGELSNGDLNECIKTFTQAIDISNTSTVLFVKRATLVVYMFNLFTVKNHFPLIVCSFCL